MVSAVEPCPAKGGRPFDKLRQLTVNGCSIPRWPFDKLRVNGCLVSLRSSEAHERSPSRETLR